MLLLRPLAPAIPKQVWSHLWFQGNFTARVEGTHFRVFHSGNEIENGLFWRDTFEQEPGTFQIAAKLLPKVDCFIDVGANIGVYSLLAKAICPNVRVVAIEPSIPNLKLLRHNLALNDFDVTVVEAAATSKAGKVVLYDFPECSSSSSLEKGWRDGTVERLTQATTLDNLAAKHGLTGKTLIKIDVEGHEVQVLEGARKLIRSKPMFLIEIIRENVAKRLREILTPIEFSYFFIDEMTGMLMDATSGITGSTALRWGNYLVRTKSDA
jgi:FkbM family methyltransferase